MKKLMLLLLFALSSLSYGATGGVLFFQSSTKANIAKLHNNSYILTLSNVPAYISYLTQSPVKKSGLINLKQFVALWGNKTLKDNVMEKPPHAALSLVSQNSVFQNATVVVSNPSYVKDSLSYQITVMDNKLLEIGKLKHLVLIFDDIAWNPGG